MENETENFLKARKSQLETIVKEAMREMAVVDAGLKAFGVSRSPKIMGSPVRARGKETVPQKIVNLLKVNSPMTRDEVCALYTKEYGKEISLISMSSYLSVLKKDQQIGLNNEGKWFFPKKEAPNKEASDLI